uniref:Outer capsid glycoprotein VP7 n=1 Tax=Rotavirus G pigeon/HK18 TaxID=1399970 RepID=U3QY93_9REOV|nr:VP7 [Rotavirus G pigeon/HK18]
MFMLTLLSLAAVGSSQLIIEPVIKNSVCLAYPNEEPISELNGNFTNIFSSYSGVHFQLINYSLGADKDVIQVIRNLDVESCPTLAVYITDASLDFVTFLSAENRCQRFKQGLTHYIKLPVENEYFTYSKTLKFCPLSNDLIGIYCDSQLKDTYHTVIDQATYDIVDIPEFTEMGYLFYSDSDFYICERLATNEYMDVYYFYKDQPAAGTVTKAIDWNRVWTNFKKVAQVAYKILDIFFGKKTVEPRA